MRAPRYSIATLLAVIGFTAVAAAALRAASAAWDSGVFAGTLLALLTAGLLAVHRAGEARAFWLGFVWFGAAYFLISSIPPLAARLPTTRMLAYLGALRPVPSPLGVAVADFDSDGQVDLLFTNTSTPKAVFLNTGNGTFRQQSPPISGGNGSPIFADFPAGGWPTTWRAIMGTGGTSDTFVRIGHCLVTLLAAFAGGLLSRFLSVHRAPTRTDATPSQN